MSNAVGQFRFDAVGNRASASNEAGTAAYAYVSGCNRLASFGSGTSVGHDAAGCVTSIVYSATQSVALAWDGRYRLTAVATSGTAVEAYGYDALNRRAWTSNSTDGVVWHIYDGWQVVADVDATGGVLRTYSWMPGKIDRLLTIATASTGGITNVYCAITDQIGTVHALTDTNGVIVESYVLDAWGQVLSVLDAAGNPLTSAFGLPTSGVGNRYLFQGREYSWTTRLYNFRHRCYDPVTGRWLSNDPIGISGGLNQYAFCGNNPVSWRDPWGLVDLFIGGGVSATIAWGDAERSDGLCGVWKAVQASAETDFSGWYRSRNVDSFDYPVFPIRLDRESRSIGWNVDVSGSVMYGLGQGEFTGPSSKFYLNTPAGGVSINWTPGWLHNLLHSKPGFIWIERSWGEGVGAGFIEYETRRWF